MAALTGTSKKNGQAGRASSRSGIPALPQVDLLPPEVRDGRRLAVRRRLLVYVVLIVFVSVCLGVAFAFLIKTNADNRLAEAQDRATALAAEKKKYSEVTGVIRAIDDTKEVRNFSVVTEVNWMPYIDAIAAELPDGVTIDSFEVEQASPTATAPTAKDPVVATGLGTITFIARSAELPNAADWADALNLIPGFQDATVQNVAREVSRDDGKKVEFVVNVSVQINGLALANREFDDREVGAKADSESSDDETETEDETDES